MFLAIFVHCFLLQKLSFQGVGVPAKPCQEDWVELSSPGNTSSDAATLSLSHLQQGAETDLAKVEDGGRRQTYTLKSRRLRSLAETMLVSKVAEAMLGLVLVLLETTTWLLAWRNNKTTSAPILLLLPTPISALLWLTTRWRKKSPNQVKIGISPFGVLEKFYIFEYLFSCKNYTS